MSKIRVITHSSKKRHLRDLFFRHTGYELNLEQPKTFNEKIQWLKLHYRDELLTICSDKHAVRQYVIDTLGSEDYLVDILGVYDNPGEIDFETLPNKFVLKTNNGSGTNIICRNKDQLNIKDSIDKLNKWMQPGSNHYFFAYEWCYKNIKPKIICEKYIEEVEGDLLDYKFLCFNGKVELLFVCSERQSNELKVDFFDINWNKLPFTRHYKNSEKEIKKPKNLEKMIKVAEKLAKPFPFVRVDLYEIANTVKFSELTFYPGSGFEAFQPFEWDEKIGNLIVLPEQKSRRYLPELYFNL